MSNGHLLKAFSIRYAAIVALMGGDDGAVSISMFDFSSDRQDHRSENQQAHCTQTTKALAVNCNLEL